VQGEEGPSASDARRCLEVSEEEGEERRREWVGWEDIDGIEIGEVRRAVVGRDEGRGCDEVSKLWVGRRSREGRELGLELRRERRGRRSIRARGHRIWWCGGRSSSSTKLLGWARGDGRIRTIRDTSHERTMWREKNYEEVGERIEARESVRWDR
jgi:hypothetical protein